MLRRFFHWLGAATISTLIMFFYFGEVASDRVIYVPWPDELSQEVPAPPSLDVPFLPDGSLPLTISAVEEWGKPQVEFKVFIKGSAFEDSRLSIEDLTLAWVDIYERGATAPRRVELEMPEIKLWQNRLAEYLDKLDRLVREELSKNSKSARLKLSSDHPGRSAVLY